MGYCPAHFRSLLIHFSEEEPCTSAGHLQDPTSSAHDSDPSPGSRALPCRWCTTHPKRCLLQGPTTSDSTPREEVVRNRRDLASSCTHQRGVLTVPRPGTLYTWGCVHCCRGTGTNTIPGGNERPRPMGSSPDDRQGALSVLSIQSAVGPARVRGLENMGVGVGGQARGLGKKEMKSRFQMNFFGVAKFNFYFSG